MPGVEAASWMAVTSCSVGAVMGMFTGLRNSPLATEARHDLAEEVDRVFAFLRTGLGTLRATAR